MCCGRKQDILELKLLRHSLNRSSGFLEIVFKVKLNILIECLEIHSLNIEEIVASQHGKMIRLVMLYVNLGTTKVTLA